MSDNLREAESLTPKSSINMPWRISLLPIKSRSSLPKTSPGNLPAEERQGPATVLSNYRKRRGGCGNRTAKA